MAHHLSAKKRIRQTLKRTVINRSQKSRLRTIVKKAELAIAGDDKDHATKALLAAEAELSRGVSKGIIHRNTASRKTSRLFVRLHNMDLVHE